MRGLCILYSRLMHLEIFDDTQVRDSIRKELEASRTVWTWIVERTIWIFVVLASSAFEVSIECCKEVMLYRHFHKQNKCKSAQMDCRFPLPSLNR